MAKKYTYTEIKNFIEAESGSGCRLLSKEYINCKSKLKIKCLCGEDFKTTFDEFKNDKKRQCNKCGYMNGGKEHRKPHKYFINEVYQLVGNEYTVVDKYINDSTKITLRHNDCGYEWKVIPSSFLQGTRCPKCQHRSYIKTNKEIVQEVCNLVKDEYTVLEKYKGGEVKILFRHNKCGYEYYVKPNNFRNGRRCPNCSLPHTPHTEKHIAKLLKKMDIDFETQKTFADCINPKTNKKLRFDFAIYSNNKNLFCLLEYDGKQHFEPVKFFGGKKSLALNQYRDNIKNDYCRQNNIKLIRIPYWDFSNLEEILQNNLRR